MDRSWSPDVCLPRILESLRKRVSRQQFETWFRDIRLLDVSPDRSTLGVPNTFYREWLLTYLLDAIRAAYREALNIEPAIDIVVIAAPSAPEPPAGTAPGGSSAAALRARAEPARTGSLMPDPRYPGFSSDVPLNDAYTIGQFVVGPTNALAHAAAMAVTEKPALSYNPLFLHGGVGLGKTHLLQAVCRSLLERRPDLRIVYLSCETFANQFIQAVQGGDLKGFRYRYREVDVLVIDDIHFLANKERTQEEFFHTFNQLYNSRRQIILSSDSHPRDIPSIEERLVSRFKWGLVTQIEPPGFETRLQIVRMKSERRGTRFPEDVCEFLANQSTSNIREIEGALHKVFSFADLHNRRIDLALVREALRDTDPSGPQVVSMEAIVRAVTTHFSVKPAELQSKRRSRSIAYPRQICMYLARRLTSHSLVEIGAYFGGRDHTTVIYAVERIGAFMRVDAEAKALVEHFMREIRGH